MKTWVHFRKRLYFPLLVVLICAAVFAISATPANWRPLATVALLVVLIVPGAIGRLILKDLLASRAAIARGEFEQGLAAARRFLAQYERHPWIEHAIWTQFGTYTLSVRAMALNNAGAALLELRRLAEARGMLSAARAADAAYPIPVFNLAVAAKLDGEEAASNALAAQAVELGFASGDLDNAMRAVGETYARLATPR